MQQLKLRPAWFLALISLLCFSCTNKKLAYEHLRMNEYDVIEWENAKLGFTVHEKGEIAGFEETFAKVYGSDKAFVEEIENYALKKLNHVQVIDVDSPTPPGLDFVIFVERWSILQSAYAIQRPPTMGQPYASSRSSNVCHILLEGGVQNRAGQIIYRGEIDGSFVFRHDSTLKDATRRATAIFLDLIRGELPSRQVGMGNPS